MGSPPAPRAGQQEPAGARAAAPSAAADGWREKPRTVALSGTVLVMLLVTYRHVDLTTVTAHSLGGRCNRKLLQFGKWGANWTTIVKNPEPSAEDNFATRAALDLIQKASFMHNSIDSD
eukprot:SAG31_NODE_8043_length_1534_cov_10.206272_1_plen_119_part_00